VPFPERLAELRETHGLTQQTLADVTGISSIQIHRYEAGTSQPTLKALRKLAKARRVSADALVFDQDERGPDEDMKLQFEAVSQFGTHEKEAAKDVLDALILKHQARRSTGTERERLT
jgi:transcriptional regulator with XRE-family HTH domain